MNIKIREQAGTDAVRKFDYQMAVALDYLLSEIDGDVIILIETLEDFAVLHNFGSEFEKIDVYQVKTKDSDPISSYNSNLSKMDTAKDSLNDAYDSCGDYKELQSLKKKIKSAIDSLPTGKVYNTDDFNSKLEDFKEFSYDLYEAQMEVAKYIDSK